MIRIKKNTALWHLVPVQAKIIAAFKLIVRLFLIPRMQNPNSLYNIFYTYFRKESTGKDKIYYAVLAYLDKQNVKFTHQQVGTLCKQVVSELISCGSWMHITRRSVPGPATYQRFSKIYWIQ